MHFTYNISFNPCKLYDIGVSNKETEAQRSEVTLVKVTRVVSSEAEN